MDINYELYKVFYHVAATLSFSEASKQLFISQSAVSQSIKVAGKEAEPAPISSAAPSGYSSRLKAKFCLKHIEPAMNLIRNREKTSFWRPIP